MCNETEIIKIYEFERVKFQCIRGHVWSENYVDQGGSHKRPEDYQVQFEDTLFPYEKKIYDAVLKEIDRDPGYYKSAEPVEKTKSLIKNCGVSERDLYNFLKKITNYTGK